MHKILLIEFWSSDLVQVESRSTKREKKELTKKKSIKALFGFQQVIIGKKKTLVDALSCCCWSPLDYRCFTTLVGLQ